ncbi:MAG: DUF2029 domain-containing protein [Planctomycetia bacterium]|nr:DUF2029 domain-containing protein [Planctomycetia bacterium]
MINKINNYLRSRLQPGFLAMIAGCIILVGVTLAAISFSTSHEGTSAVGIPWGADFAGFYVAAQLLSEGHVDRLYDRELHATYYHRLFPKIPADEVIPYVHPPFVASFFRSLVWLEYDYAALIWLIISLVLYLTGLRTMLLACPKLKSRDYWLVILLALSFEPFLFECWLGGQLSAIAFLSYALTFVFYQRNRPVLAGIALGICFYKPTMVILIIPLLLVARQWKVLLGMTITGSVLLIFSLMTTGWDANTGYVQVLLEFRQSTSSKEQLAIRIWKYVDFNHFYRLLLGATMYQRVAFVVTSVIISLVLLLPGWWNWKTHIEERRKLWAVTLFLIPVINLYVGVYDSILGVLAVIIVTEWILEQSQEPAGLLFRTSWAYWLLALAVAPWFSQYLAKSAGLQVYTLLLLLLAVHAWRIRKSLSS